jgi:MFS transporter, UMF1 family
VAEPLPQFGRSSSLIERLGLHRPELRAWVLYDWANSAVMTTIIAAVFPIYFYRVAGAGLSDGVATRRFAVATVAAMVGLAVIAPVLGAVADMAAVKKKLLGLFLGIGTTATASLFFIQTGDSLGALILFAIVEMSIAATFVFYDSLLPHIARANEIDRVSTTGYALGYLGGGLLLAVNLTWIEFPQWFGLPYGENLSEAQITLPARLAFLSAAIWWAVFSIPLFCRVPEPPVESVVGPRQPLRQTWKQLRTTITALRAHPPAAWMLIAFLTYNEGIGTIIKLAAIYGAELGLDASVLVGSILIVQFVGIPCTIAFGWLAGKIGAKRSIFLGLAIYLAIALLAYAMRSATHFLVLALLVGMVQGGTQALSRSLFARLIPKMRSAEFFALFGLGEKVAGMLGPGLFVIMSAMTGSSRVAIASMIVFFIIGGLLLRRVEVPAEAGAT